MRERFLSAYALELRQILRQWSYWLIQAALLVLMVSEAARPSFVTAQELLWAGLSRNVIGLSSLIVLFLGAFAAGRARRGRMDVLEATLPTGAEIPLARWAALVTAALPFMISALGIALVTGPIESFLRGLPVFLLESTLTLVFTASLVWAIETAVGIRRAMFPLLGLLWIATIMVGFINGPAFAPWTGQWNFARFGGSSYTESWGRLLQTDFPWLLNLFYVALTVMTIGLIVRAVHRTRFYRTPTLAWGLIGAGGAAAAVVYIVYGVTFMQAHAQADGSIMTYYSFSSSDGPQGEPIHHTVTRYDVALDLEATPAFGVTMDVLNTGDAPLDTLEFTLTESVEIQSASLPFSRDGAFVTFTPETPLAPSASVTLDIEYGGSIRRFVEVWGSMPPELQMFVTDAGIYLPFGSNWYPRAGHRDLDRNEILINRRLGIGDPYAAFSLRVTGADMPLASNLPRTGDNSFESAGTTWATLIGAPELETFEVVEGVQIVATQARYEKMRDSLQAWLTPVREIVSQYFPGETLILMSGPRYMIGETVSVNEPYPMTDIAATSSTFSPWPGAGEWWVYEYGIFLPAQHFFGDTRTTLLTENVAQFVSAQIRHEGNAAAMREGIQRRLDAMYHGTPPPAADEEMELFSPSPGFAMNYGIALRLVDAYDEYGTEGVVALLNAMRAEIETLRVSVTREVVAWMDAWVTENLSDV